MRINVMAGGDEELRAPIRQAVEVFVRCLRERCAAEVAWNDASGWRLEILLAQENGPDGFELEDIYGGVRLTAWNRLGLLQGLGKLLRDGRCDEAGFTPGPWRGIALPKLEVRGIYFATHFHNWYHVAPVDEIQRYVEDLALWGTNTLCVWFDMHHFSGIGDPKAQEMLSRLKAILSAAKRIGMRTAAIFLANEAYANSPEALRADWTAGHDGYFKEPGGHYHVELCPSKPGGLDLILRWAEERMQAFQEVGLDYICIWPYDQGGCTCRDCAPWGINGYLRCAEPLTRLFRRYFPQGKVILSTWYFDHFVSGEWSGLGQAFQQKPDWVDLLLADDYGDHFPPYLVERGAPGELPVVGFPEISMYRCLPWGGYGANPLPVHFQNMWQQCARLLQGGFPYSEGIFEDLNKAVMAQLYWDPRRDTAEIVREYCRYEFGWESVEALSQAIAILEANLPRQAAKDRILMESFEFADRADSLMAEVDARMDPQRKKLWRWRMLRLRARIDALLARNKGRLEGEELKAAFAEITTLSHAADALEDWVRPPVFPLVGAA